MNVEAVAAKTYQASRSGTKTQFTLEAYYPCTTSSGRCACARYWLVGSNVVSGDGMDTLPPIRALAGRQVPGWASAIFGAEHCWIQRDFDGLVGFSALFVLMSIGYLSLKMRAKT